MDAKIEYSKIKTKRQLEKFIQSNNRFCDMDIWKFFRTVGKYKITLVKGIIYFFTIRPYRIQKYYLHPTEKILVKMEYHKTELAKGWNSPKVNYYEGGIN